MERLSTSAEVSTSQEMFESLRKSMDLFMTDYSERKRSERTGGTRFGRESVPMQVDASGPLLRFSSLGVDPRIIIGVESGPANPIVVKWRVGNVYTAVSHGGGEPEVDTGHELPTVGVASGPPRTSNMCLRVDRGCVYVGVLCRSGHATDAANLMVVMVCLWEVFPSHRT